MATGDIWKCELEIITRQSAASIGMHYRVNTDPTDPLDGIYLARAFEAHIIAQVRACLVSATKFGLLCAKPVYPLGAFTGWVVPSSTGGGEGGDAAPVANAVQIILHQSAGSPRQNGRVFLPALQEDRLNGNSWEAAFIAGTVQTFADQLETIVVELSAGPGRWQPVVLSKSFTPPATPRGTALNVVKAQAVANVARQSKRRGQGTFLGA